MTDLFHVLGHISFHVRPMPGDAGESFSTMTSFTSTLFPGTKGATDQPNTNKNSPDSQKSISETEKGNSRVEDELSEGEDEDEKPDGDYTSGSDASDNEMEYEDDDDCYKGKVALDFQSEGGSFKKPGRSRFDRNNWRGESEKMTGCSYV